MMGLFRLTLLFPLMLAATVAHAQIFMCKDASGRTITSDRPIPECADRSMRELDNRGAVRREIAAPMTAEQKRQAQLQEEKRKADEAVLAEQKSNDRAIRSRYKTEADIEAARKRSLEPVEEQIKREKTTLAAAEKQQTDVAAEVETLKKKNAAVPAGLQKKADDAALAASDSKKLLQEHEAEVVQVNAKYDATLKRYRELTGVTAAK